MPKITIYLLNGVQITDESDDDFIRLRDAIEGILDCDETLIVDRLEQRVGEAGRRRVALLVPRSAVGVVAIEEPLPEVQDDEAGSATHHVVLP